LPPAFGGPVSRVASAGRRRAEENLPRGDVGLFPAAPETERQTRPRVRSRGRSATFHRCLSTAAPGFPRGAPPVCQRYAHAALSARLGVWALRILVVTIRSTCVSVVEALSSDGHTVDPAENGRPAIQLFYGSGLRPWCERPADAAYGRAQALLGDLQAAGRRRRPVFVFITGETIGGLTGNSSRTPTAGVANRSSSRSSATAGDVVPHA